MGAVEAAVPEAEEREEQVPALVQELAPVHPVTAAWAVPGMAVWETQDMAAWGLRDTAAA